MKNKRRYKTLLKIFNNPITAQFYMLSGDDQKRVLSQIKTIMKKL